MENKSRLGRYKLPLLGATLLLLLGLIYVVPGSYFQTSLIAQMDPGMGNMDGMQGYQDMGGMQGYQDMGGMQGDQGMGGMQGYQDMGGMQGDQGMGGMPCMNGTMPFCGDNTCACYSGSGSCPNPPCTGAPMTCADGQAPSCPDNMRPGMMMCPDMQGECPTQMDTPVQCDWATQCPMNGQCVEKCANGMCPNMNGQCGTQNQQQPLQGYCNNNGMCEGNIGETPTCADCSRNAPTDQQTTNEQNTQTWMQMEMQCGSDMHSCKDNWGSFCIPNKVSGCPVWENGKLTSCPAGAVKCSDPYGPGRCEWEDMNRDGSVTDKDCNAMGGMGMGMMGPQCGPGENFIADQMGGHCEAQCDFSKSFWCSDENTCKPFGSSCQRAGQQKDAFKDAFSEWQQPPMEPGMKQGMQPQFSIDGDIQRFKQDLKMLQQEIAMEKSRFTREGAAKEVLALLDKAETLRAALAADPLKGLDVEPGKCFAPWLLWEGEGRLEPECRQMQHFGNPCEQQQFGGMNGGMGMENMGNMFGPMMNSMFQFQVPGFSSTMPKEMGDTMSKMLQGVMNMGQGMMGGFDSGDSSMGMEMGKGMGMGMGMGMPMMMMEEQCTLEELENSNTVRGLLDAARRTHGEKMQYSFLQFGLQQVKQGLAQAEQMGAPAEMLAEAKGLYAKAQAAYDAEKYEEAKQLLNQLDMMKRKADIQMRGAGLEGMEFDIGPKSDEFFMQKYQSRGEDDMAALFEKMFAQMEDSLMSKLVDRIVSQVMDAVLEKIALVMDKLPEDIASKLSLKTEIAAVLPGALQDTVLNREAELAEAGNEALTALETLPENISEDAIEFVEEALGTKLDQDGADNVGSAVATITATVEDIKVGEATVEDLEAAVEAASETLETAKETAPVMLVAEGSQSFLDAGLETTHNWDEQYLLEGRHEGIVEGKKDVEGNFTGNVEPLRPINRMESLKTALNAVGIEVDPDVSHEDLVKPVEGLADWAVPYFVAAQEAGIDSALNPEGPVNEATPRTEYAVILYEASDKAGKVEGSPQEFAAYTEERFEDANLMTPEEKIAAGFLATEGIMEGFGEQSPRYGEFGAKEEDVLTRNQAIKTAVDTAKTFEEVHQFTE